MHIAEPLCRSIAAQSVEPSTKEAVQASAWRATGFDSSMIDRPSDKGKDGLSQDELAGSIAGRQMCRGAANVARLEEGLPLT